MNTKLAVFLFVVTIFECNGHLPILGDIISAAHDRVHSTVEGVAGAVLGGLNLNFGGHLGFKNQERRPQNNPQETIVVVIEEDNDSNDRMPNNYHRPMHHGHRPHHRPNPGYNDHNQGNYNQNEYDNQQKPGNQGNGYNNFYGNKDQNGHYNDQNNGNYNNNGYTDNHQKYPIQPGEHQENSNQNPYVNGNTEQFHNNPTTEFIPTKYNEVTPSQKDDEIYKITKKPSDDVPLFIPLNPEEYVYGGDKINITAPKRDTEKTKQAEDEDEDFPIDIRFKNE